ncbi:hypothetical protein DM01DRAFT_261874 [Hesseltinella vesiculosa]|uniref:Uncharacterized protein n=1 Tax=Hesseltinella vesiculosa TaxID=101127 RepID=A0A1X2GDA6_9FUNG|nr:hypothetical protein DM01DRAFT_261874 [Hesseltinella vesiculosa]
MVGGYSTASHGVYFAKIQSSNVTATFALFGYCVQEQNKPIHCVHDESVKLLPFAVTVANTLNDTYPYLFLNANTLDENVHPDSVAMPSHDPKIFAAIILTLLCSGCAFLIGIAKMIFYAHVEDESYTRGFFALGSAILALLLVAETTVMYQVGVDLLNLLYPNLVASAGPGIIMIGIAFAVLFLASLAYLQGCLFARNDGYEVL